MAKLPLRSIVQTLLKQGKISVSFYVKQPQVVGRMPLKFVKLMKTVAHGIWEKNKMYT